jgi:hypothetical protein
MRQFQKRTKALRCALRIDVEHDMEVLLSAPSRMPDECMSPEFREVIRSANVLAMIRDTLAVLFGIGAPTVSSIAADVERQLLHVEVSGGQRGAEQLRAACAMISSVTGPVSDTKGRVAVRVSVQRASFS